jgi:hypothetical protein
MIGSFTLGGNTINVESTYNHIDGVAYQLIDATSGTRLAATTYRGLEISQGVKFSKNDLDDGLRTVLRQYSRR